MASWADKWLGWPWDGRDGDLCAELAETVLREEFGRTVSLPGGPRMQAAAARAAAGDTTIACCLLSGRAPREMRIRLLRDGDGVLMLQRGARREYHIGLYAAPDRVLHHVAGAGAMLQPLADLAGMGLCIEGFYR